MSSHKFWEQSCSSFDCQKLRQNIGKFHLKAYTSCFRRKESSPTNQTHTQKLTKSLFLNLSSTTLIVCSKLYEKCSLKQVLSASTKMFYFFTFLRKRNREIYTFIWTFFPPSFWKRIMYFWFYSLKYLQGIHLHYDILNILEIQISSFKSTNKIDLIVPRTMKVPYYYQSTLSIILAFLITYHIMMLSYVKPSFSSAWPVLQRSWK